MTEKAKKICIFLLFCGVLVAAGTYLLGMQRAPADAHSDKAALTPEKPADPPAWKMNIDAGQPAADGRDAEKDIRPVPNRVESIPLDLVGDLPQGFQSHQVWIQYMRDGNKIWVLPVYILQQAEMVGEPGEVRKVRVTLLDAINDPILYPILKNSLAQQFGKDVGVEFVHTVDDSVEVTLVHNKNNNGVVVPSELAAAQLARAPGLAQHVCEFTLPKQTPTPDSAEPASLNDFVLNFQEQARVLYTTDDVKASVHVCQETGMDFHNLVTPSPTGEKPVLLVVAGGESNSRSSIEQRFQTKVVMDIRTLQGVEPNKSLIEQLSDHLFHGIKIEKAEWEGRDGNTLTALLLPNGVRVVDTLANLKKVGDAWQNAHSHSEGHESAKSDQSSNSLDLAHSGNFGYSGFKFGHADSYSHSDSQSHSEYAANQLAQEDQEAVAKVVEGEIPACMMSVDQVEELASRCQTSWDINLGSFQHGTATFTSKQSLQMLRWAVGMKELTARKAELETKLKKDEADLVVATAAQQKAVADHLNTLYVSEQVLQAELRDKTGVVGWYEGWRVAWDRINAIGWYTFPNVGGMQTALNGFYAENDEAPYAHRGDRLAAYKARIPEIEKAIANARAEFSSTLAHAGDPSPEMVQLRDDIAKLQGDIANTSQEMVALSR